MRNILKIFSGVIILVLVSKCLGFVRESFVATIYGAGYISDVYVIEDGLINAIYTVCAGVISTTYIPKILELNKKKKDAFTSNYFNDFGFNIYDNIFTNYIKNIGTRIL